MRYFLIYLTANDMFSLSIDYLNIKNLIQYKAFEKKIEINSIGGRKRRISIQKCGNGKWFVNKQLNLLDRLRSKLTKEEKKKDGKGIDDEDFI